MKFGPMKPDAAKGGILAHSLKLADGTRLKKGALIDDEAIALLKNAGTRSIVVAMPETGDVQENAAAECIASAFGTSNLRVDVARTGRVNIYSAVNGVFRVLRETVDAINAIDPAITFATLEDYSVVNDGRMVATIKIIPYGVSQKSLDRVLELDLAGVIGVKPYQPKRVGMIATTLPGMKPSIADKTRQMLERRLSFSGSGIAGELRVPHEEGAVGEAVKKLAPGCDLLILFGASAISDTRDVIPAAIRNSNGEIKRFGMPVDPGNLLLLAELGGKPVIGAPGCARSIAENGFDWVLQRLLADIPVSGADIAGMGVGGLLMETGARPHPRERRETTPNRTAAVILAAGQSRRMGEVNKLTAELNSKPLVRHVADAVTNSRVEKAVVVTGHEPDAVMAALSGLDISQIRNDRYAEGLSTSLAAGLSALGKQTGQAIVLLGDMPFIDSAMIDRMMEAAGASPGAIIVATHNGKRGNPVVWPQSFFAELMAIKGDVGARHVMAANSDLVVEVELGEAASIDLDTPQALKAARGS